MLLDTGMEVVERREKRRRRRKISKEASTSGQDMRWLAVERQQPLCSLSSPNSKNNCSYLTTTLPPVTATTSLSSIHLTRAANPETEYPFPPLSSSPLSSLRLSPSLFCPLHIGLLLHPIRQSTAVVTLPHCSTLLVNTRRPMSHCHHHHHAQNGNEQQCRQSAGQSAEDCMW